MSPNCYQTFYIKSLGTYLNEWHFDNSCLLFLLLLLLLLLLAKVKCYQNTAKLNEFSFSLAFLFAQFEATPNWETEPKRSTRWSGSRFVYGRWLSSWRIIPIDKSCTGAFSISHFSFAPEIVYLLKVSVAAQSFELGSCHLPWKMIKYVLALIIRPVVQFCCGTVGHPLFRVPLNKLGPIYVQPTLNCFPSTH